ncbi:arylamine N-acetyltransferase, partial [Bacillus sp. VKPM B-3276]
MLTKLQENFFNRLKMSWKEDVSFKDLHGILLQMGYVLPYENLDVM